MDSLLPVTSGVKSWDISRTIVQDFYQSSTGLLDKFGIQLLILRRFQLVFRKLFSRETRVCKELYIITCFITWRRFTKLPRATTSDRRSFSTQTWCKRRPCSSCPRPILSVPKLQIVVSLTTGSAWEPMWLGSASIDRHMLVTSWNIATSMFLFSLIIFGQLIWWKIQNWWGPSCKFMRLWPWIF